MPFTISFHFATLRVFRLPRPNGGSYRDMPYTIGKLRIIAIRLAPTRSRPTSEAATIMAESRRRGPLIFATNFFRLWRPIVTASDLLLTHALHPRNPHGQESLELYNSASYYERPRQGKRFFGRWQTTFLQNELLEASCDVL